jgi:hypothetical protein
MLRSRSRLSQCKPPPRPRISTARTSRAAALLRLGISFTGKVTAAPFVSSIRRACSRARYSTSAARGSMFAARRPARDARAKFERSSLSAHLGNTPDLRIRTERLGYRADKNCPKFAATRLQGIGLSYCSGWWAVLGSNQ